MPKRANTIENQVWALRKRVNEMEKRLHALEKRTPKKRKHAPDMSDVRISGIACTPIIGIDP